MKDSSYSDNLAHTRLVCDDPLHVTIYAEIECATNTA